LYIVRTRAPVPVVVSALIALKTPYYSGTQFTHTKSQIR